MQKYINPTLPPNFFRRIAVFHQMFLCHIAVFHQIFTTKPIKIRLRLSFRIVDYELHLENRSNRRKEKRGLTLPESNRIALPILRFRYSSPKLSRSNSFLRHSVCFFKTRLQAKRDCFLLYPLSYIPFGMAGVEPATWAS